VILIPAIDIRGSRAVRLRQGDFDSETVYAEDPLDAARTWVDAGARALHVVDLDGARSGEPAAIDQLERIARELDVPVQYGGGLRSLEDVARALEAGARRAVLGTAVLSDDAFLDEVLGRFADRVVVSVDARGGRVALAGWTESTDAPADTVVARLVRRGVERIVHTDVDRDGTLEGPSLDGLWDVVTATGGRASVICSGGVGSLEDLRAIGSLGLPRLEGVIAGKALYERRFTVAEGQAALDESAVGPA
jgi:phosphoribosylformimino-5-aminoimidazole carboxamide ribotide isomerase